MGEGAGIVVLEELEHALARGAHIYGELAGFGMSGDAHHMTSPPENGEGAALSMLNAINDAGVTPKDIGYVNAHGTSTPAGDTAELRAVKSVFGEDTGHVMVSSTKSMIGHMLGAAGGAELIATILGIKEGIIPPTTNLEVPDPECDLDYVPNKPREEKINVALSNALGSRICT